MNEPIETGVSTNTIQKQITVAIPLEEEVEEKYTPPTVIEENGARDQCEESVDNESSHDPQQLEPKEKRSRRQVSIEQILLTHKGIGFNIRDVQIRYGAKFNIKSNMIRDAVLNLGSVVLCRWRYSNKDYFLKCPPQYIPLEILAKYNVHTAEYNLSYNASCSTIPADRLQQAKDFIESHFPVDPNDMAPSGFQFEDDHCSSAYRNKLNNCFSNADDSRNVTSSKSATPQHSRPTPSSSRCDTSITSGIINAISVVDTFEYDKSEEQRKRKEETSSRNIFTKQNSESAHPSSQIWRDYTEFCAVDKNGKFLGLARYMVPTSRTTKKMLSTYCIDAHLNENGEIISTFKPKEGHSLITEPK